MNQGLLCKPEEILSRQKKKKKKKGTERQKQQKETKNWS